MADRSDPAPRGLPEVLLALTFGTGLLDSVSYLRLGHVFVANMTGNVVFLGFGAAGSTDVSVSVSLTAMAAFLGGAVLGGHVSVRYGAHPQRLLAVASAIETAFVAAAFLVAVQRGGAPDSGGRYVMIALLAIAMGVQNTAARKLAVPDLTTTVLTMTLTGLAADSRWGGGENPRWGRRVLSAAAMLAGALAGGLLVLHASVAAAVGTATALLVGTSLVIRRLASRSSVG